MSRLNLLLNVPFTMLPKNTQDAINKLFSAKSETAGIVGLRVTTRVMPAFFQT